MAGEPDGTLRDWRDIATKHEWEVLLLGNGMSINVWEPFGYRKLYDRAKQRGLSAEDRDLFRSTPNFERVLGDLLTAIRVTDAYGLGNDLLVERYDSIQRALISTIRAVHLGRASDRTLETINATMKRFDWVFTTSYDLLVYWAMAFDGFKPFMDHFRFEGRCQFDPDRADVIPGKIPVYFLHGALHLVAGSSGATWKLTQTKLANILDQFGKPIEGDARARPLLVTEGSAGDKLVAIEENVYLSHALNALRKPEGPVVVFGSSLSEHDAHLASALSEKRERPIAISMLQAPRKELLLEQSNIYGRLEASELLFFDATTHPLGSPALRAKPIPQSKR
ncbi:MAG TPA: DUF4917 family protein [Solirubrobacterales bacterium]|nr:DUF4917 family protein [Solirubrobacterales bacterium]